ncbi:MAG: polyamine aminopropyltransferase [Burkholderiaceae bacterium]
MLSLFLVPGIGISGWEIMQGLHLTADLYTCGCDISLMTVADELSGLCRRLIDKSGLTIVDEKFFTFPDYEGEPGGVTGAVLLAESHLALHTWPERMGVTLDVYVCNFTTDNSMKAERLLDELIIAFAPGSSNTNRILRGSADQESRADELLLEWLNPYSAYGYRALKRLETRQTPYQTLEVFDTAQFGKLFRLDGCYMTSERDEFFYHEPMIHTAAISHPAPRRALVVGGGDGGSAEELLKHPGMERVVVAELDPDVVAVARRHLQKVHRGALDDPRVEVRIGDGWSYVERTEERFDLVVLDLTDPDTPAHKLYTQAFFALLKRVMNEGAYLTLHIGSPIFKPEVVARHVTSLRQVFSCVRPMGVYIPLYGTYWGLACATDAQDPLALSAGQIDARIAERALPDLQYYNGDTHHGLFALPNYYRKIVDPD